MTEKSNINDLGAQLQGIAQVLRNRKLRLPLFQRPYSWTHEQVQVFWNDLRSAFLMNNSNYFLGSLLLAAGSGPREYEVIDGQQRLTTTALLIAALRDTFIESEEYSRAEALQGEYLTSIDLRQGGKVARLSLNSIDDPTYRSIASGLKIQTQDLAPSAQRLIRSYELLKENLVIELASSGDMWREKVIALSEFLEIQVRVIVLDVSSTADAFTIFETLNDRGLALSVADLLKNHLYGLASADNEDVATGWDQMIATLGELNDEQTVLDYLRHFWCSWYGVMRERDLYRGFRSQITTRQSAISVVGHLSRESTNYLALVSGEQSLWPGNVVTKIEAEIFQVLHMAESRPLFLAMLENFEPIEIKKSIRLIVKFWFRTEMVGKPTSSALDKIFCNSAIRVRAAKISTCNQLRKFLSDHIPNDKQFKKAFLTRQQTPTRVSKYILLALKNQEANMPCSELVRLDDFARSNIVAIISPQEYERDGTKNNAEDLSIAAYKVVIRKNAHASASHPENQTFIPYFNAMHEINFNDIFANRREIIAETACKIWNVEDDV